MILGFSRRTLAVMLMAAAAILVVVQPQASVEAATTLRTFGGYRYFADVATVDDGIAVRASNPYAGTGPVLWSKGGREWRKIASAAYTLSEQRTGALAVNDAGVRELTSTGSRRLMSTPYARGYDRYFNDVHATGSSVFLASTFISDEILPVVWTGERGAGWEGSRTLPAEYNGSAEVVLPNDDRSATIVVQESAGDSPWLTAWRMRTSGSYRKAANPKMDLVRDAHRPSKAILGGRYTWPLGMTAARVASFRDGRWIRDTIRSVPRREVRTGTRLPNAQALVRRSAGRFIAGGSADSLRCNGSYEACQIDRSLPVLWRKTNSGRWAEQQLPLNGYRSGIVFDIALVRGGLIAVGSVWTPGEGRRAALWKLT